MKNINKKKGFTLVELIIVIAIIGILGAIAVPKFASIQQDAKIKADIASARVIADATRALIAKDGITETAGYSESSELGEDIKGYIEVEPVVKAIKNGKFNVKIDTGTETVHVTVGGIELYPKYDTTYPTIPTIKP